ncbi:MAG TPA: bacillithiol biosynthesis cysteine-adding enzyme BshC [Flavobacteriales bacterium]|nr:bacillithiol biosynthesis cysteine-adding enzyme BshC [Flavobacteriales bacterium]
MFKASRISLDQISNRLDSKRLFSNQLIKDYLLKTPGLMEFYKYEAGLSSFKQIITDKSKESIDRSVLVNVLEEQYAKIQDAPTNIQLLKDSNTYTITTGHQLCMCTGPLYFIFKIITTINLAGQLKSAHPDKNFVPLFWMATEDHDFEEINHAHVFSRKLVWDDFQGGPVGAYTTKSMSGVLDEMSDLLGGDNNSVEIAELFRASYTNHDNLADATRYLIHQLFGKYGLVVLDPGARKLKECFTDIMKEDLANRGIYKHVRIASKALQKKYKLLVNAREVNLFYINAGKRERINADGSAFKIGEKAVSKKELLEELANNPERFSPNVILRTLYQERVLPNLAYVGGPGEIAYWLQFKGAFDNYNINFPMLVLRNSAFIITKNLSAKLDKLGIKVDNLFQSTDELIRQFIAATGEAEISLAAEATELEGFYDKLKVRIEAIDKSLVDAVGAEKQKASSGLQHIEKKMLKAQKQYHEVSINQIKNVKNKLFPGNSIQERHDNISQYIAVYGMELLDQLLEHLKPLTGGVTVLEGK